MFVSFMKGKQVAKSPPKPSDTFINKVIRDFYNCTTSDLPFSVEVPEDVNIENFYKRLRKSLYQFYGFDKKVFYISKKMNRRIIEIGLKKEPTK